MTVRTGLTAADLRAIERRARRSSAHLKARQEAQNAWITNAIDAEDRTTEIGSFTDQDGVAMKQQRDNARFFAAARTDVLALVAALRATRRGLRKKGTR